MGGKEQIMGLIDQVKGGGSSDSSGINIGTPGINIGDMVKVSPMGLNIQIPTMSGVSGNSPMGITNMNNNVSRLVNTGPGSHSIVQVNGRIVSQT